MARLCEVAGCQFLYLPCSPSPWRTDSGIKIKQRAMPSQNAHIYGLGLQIFCFHRERELGILDSNIEGYHFEN